MGPASKTNHATNTKSGELEDKRFQSSSRKLHPGFTWCTRNFFRIKKMRRATSVFVLCVSAFVLCNCLSARASNYYNYHSYNYPPSPLSASSSSVLETERSPSPSSNSKFFKFQQNNKHSYNNNYNNYNRNYSGSPLPPPPENLNEHDTNDKQKKEEIIRESVSTFCERCSDAQRHKVEQILFLLFNLNTNISGNKNNSLPVIAGATSDDDDDYAKTKKKHKKKKFSPTRYHVTDSYSNSNGILVTTPSSRYPPSTLPLSSTSTSTSTKTPMPHRTMTTVSSALEPLQSVEMPTPPMPPTTSGPIYLYYLETLNNAGPDQGPGQGQGQIQPPTTTTMAVVESSVASKPTTIQP